jgi:hypothetical protein
MKNAWGKFGFLFVLAGVVGVYAGVTALLPPPGVKAQAPYIMPPWPDGIGRPGGSYVPDQIAGSVKLAQERLNDDWANCLRCLKGGVGGEASNLSGYRSFNEQAPPAPGNFNGSFFDFEMAFESGSILKVRMAKDKYVPMEWRPVPVTPGGAPFRVLTTTRGEIECPNGLAAVFVAYRNGK